MDDLRLIVQRADLRLGIRERFETDLVGGRHSSPGLLEGGSGGLGLSQGHVELDLLSEDLGERRVVLDPLQGRRGPLEVRPGAFGLAQLAHRAVGVDLSPGMLEHARARGLDVHEASATELPFEDASFDAAVSFKVLAHVEQIAVAMGEMGRVVRPGGRVMAEFYNRRSMRALVKSVVSPGSIGKDGAIDESDVYTRFDTIADIEAYLPDNLKLVGVDGIRVLSPAALLFNLPLLGPLWTGVERLASKTPLKHLGGFLVVHCERV